MIREKVGISFARLIPEVRSAAREEGWWWGDVLRATGPMKSKETRKKMHQHQAGCSELMPVRRMRTDKVFFENPLVWGVANMEKGLEKNSKREKK